MKFGSVRLRLDLRLKLDFLNEIMLLPHNTDQEVQTSGHVKMFLETDCLNQTHI